jgi:demethylmenaquinone methyltransferase/2-methoxy-6-polyprenyl-1,4-benzoquinol methylase
MFGEIAGRYDLLNHVLSLGVDVYWRWRTVKTVPPDGAAPILDVCTGTGDLAIAYRRRSGDALVVGSDFTRPMLQIAKAKTESQPASAPEARGLPFVEADALQLPFADDQFQIVSVAFGLRNVSDTRRGLREMVRVCRPGGRVAVLEFSRPDGSILGGLYRWYFRHVLPRIGQWVSNSRSDAYRYLPESVGEFPNGQRLADVMTECGLAQVQFRPLTFGIATLYWGVKP